MFWRQEIIADKQRNMKEALLLFLIGINKKCIAKMRWSIIRQNVRICRIFEGKYNLLRFEW